MSGSRYTRRTHSTLRQLQTLREVEVKFKIQDTATLVSGYNEARTSHEHHNAFLLWTRMYISFFEKEITSECCHKAMEFAQLANISPKGPSEIRLLEDAFNLFCRKIHLEEHGERELIEAFNYFLLSVDCKVFENNPHPLTKIARDVMKKLGPEQTFSRGTYPTHSISLLALHHICALIHEVDPSEFDHNKQEGLYQEMQQCLKNIIDSQSYYPFYYQATMTQQSLASMDSNGGLTFRERWYRVLCGVKGTAYFCRALACAASMNFDFDGLENGIRHWIQVFSTPSIKHNSWYENVQPLIGSKMLVQNDPEKLDILENCFFKVEQIQKETQDRENQIALRFAMIREVTLLALDCEDESVRKWAIVQLTYIGKCCKPDKGWAQDSEILEALVGSVLEIRGKVGFHSEMEGVQEVIRFHVGEEKWPELVQHWEQGARWDEDNEEVSTSNDSIGDDTLFNKIKKELCLDDSVSTRADTQDMLKKHYVQNLKVPSLFGSEPERNVDTLDHSLLFYEKVFTPNGQAQVVQRPILLDDLFANKQISRRTLSEPVKRVLLFGNPGTGKTSIAKKIAYKWSVDQWGDAFDMLYLIPVRELSYDKYDDRSMRSRKNLQTAITNICFFGKDDDTYKMLRMQVAQELNKATTLVVFDGLDEGEETAKEMIRSTEKMICRVIVLSRPHGLHNERISADMEVECVGLNDEQLVNFIESECSSIELVKHLQRHSDVWVISHTPVVANILTFLYKTRKEDLISEESSFNMYLLYWKMSVEVWKRYLEKTNCNAMRDLIFDALEEVAFHALKDGHIFIGQEMVHEVSRDRQTSDILKDSGFLLLKRECAYYQFPHLTFQEFFAGQYMAHSLLSRDERRKRRTVDFLNENKYCANFKQVFCFMIQALTSKNNDEGYLEVEAIVDSTPTALGYRQHEVLNMELLEASLAALRPEDRETILDSTEVLDSAFDWIQHRECYSDTLMRTPSTAEQNLSLVHFYGMSNDYWTEKCTELLVQVAKVARYVPERWAKVMEILETYLNEENGTKAAFGTVSLIRAIPEERDNLLEMYWTLFECPNNITITAALFQYSAVARSMPNTATQLFDRVTRLVFEDSSLSTTLGLTVDFPRLAQVMPDRWKEVLEMIKRTTLDREIDDHERLNQLGRLVKFVPESGGQVMELIREMAVADNQSKKSIARSCLSLVKAMPENSAEIVEILWTLCEDEGVCIGARIQAVEIVLSWGEKTEAAVDVLLSLSEREPHSSHSSLVRLVAISYKLIEETPEGVDRLLSCLSQKDLTTLWQQVALCIRDSIGTKTEIEMGLHWLHFMIVKALELPEVEEHELHTMVNNEDSDPIEISVISAKLLGSRECPGRLLAPMTLGKLALNCPDFEEWLFDSLDDLSRDEEEYVAVEACVQMFSVLKRLPQKAERVMNRLQESLHRLSCFYLLRMRDSVSLDSLIGAYMKCHNDFLVFWIVWKSFDTPVTMETKRNRKTELIVQTASNNKKRYKFQTFKEAQDFASSFDKCIEVVFPDVASLVPRLDSQERERSSRPLFEKLREILA